MKKNDWKDRLNIVYSTNPDFAYETEGEEEPETLEKEKQNLRVFIEKKNRGGKTATVVKGFAGTDAVWVVVPKTVKSSSRANCGTRWWNF